MGSMFRFVFTVLLILSVLPGHVAGQKAVDRNLVAAFGISNLHILDELASPLVFSHTGIAPSIRYNARRPNSNQYIEGSFFYNHLKTAQDNFSVRNYSGRFRYAYFYTPFRLKLAENDLNISFGGSFTSFFNRSEYEFEIYYNSTTSRAITSWYWSHSIDPGFQVEYYLKERTFFSLQFYIPVISNVSRPTYSSSGDYNYTTNEREINVHGETVFFPENASYNCLLTFGTPISEKLSLHVGYDFYLAHYNLPDNIDMYMNNFRIGLSYYFRKSKK
jgi:hypothetical protein